MNDRAVRTAAWTALAATFLVAGYWLINTTFMPYDDEGFVLLSLRNFLGGLRLYDDVFTQYGPWPYAYHYLLTGGGHLPVTHDFGRLVTLVHWAATALLCGAITVKLARHQLAALATTSLVFGYLWQNIAEPSHPGSHLALLVALAAFAVVHLPNARSPVVSGFFLGTLAAALLLTKINVGVFLIAGLSLHFAHDSAVFGRNARALRFAAIAAGVTLPWLLLRRELPAPWALTLALQFTFAFAGWCWLPQGEQMPAPMARRAGAAIVLGTLGVTGVLLGWLMLSRGTTWPALREGLLLAPLRMSANFLVPLRWHPESYLMAVAGALAVAKAGWDLRRHRQLSPVALASVASLRLGVLAFGLFEIQSWPGYLGVFHFAGDCVPLLPLFLVPLSPDTAPSIQRARRGLTVLALLQFLHVYPVAGSQLGWATFLAIPALVVGLSEVAQVLRTRFAFPRLAMIVNGALACAGSIVLALVLHTGWERFHTSRSIGLPGAEAIHVEEGLRTTYRVMALNAGIHADVLISHPGMYSLNLWSGAPTPTAQNATQWAWLLTPEQQQAIVSRLEATPRSAFISSVDLEKLMAEKRIPTGGILQDFVTHHYRPLFAQGDLVFQVPRETPAIAFGKFEIREAPADQTTALPLLYLSPVLLDGVPAHIRLERWGNPVNLGPELISEATRVSVEPIDRAGNRRGAAIALPSPQPLRGLYRLSILAPRLPEKFLWQEHVLVVRDAENRVLSESVY